MSAVERRGAPEPHRENRPSRNPDFKRPRRLPARPRHPVSTSTWLPDGSRSAPHAHRSPVYVSFVSRATLWDRGLCHYTAPDRPNHRPLLCPRFLSHMNARPEDLRPPCFLSSKSRLQPPSQEKMLNTHTLTAARTRALEGHVHLNPDGRRNRVQMTGSSPAVVVPSLPLPAAPPSSTFNPTPPHLNNLHDDFETQQSKPDSVPASPSRPHPASEGKEEFHERERTPAELSVTESPEQSPPPASTISHGSLSDFSRPPSSLFSRSTDLASGSSSVLSDIRDSDPEGSTCFSPLRPCSVMESPSGSSPPAGCNPRQSSTNATATPPLCEPLPPRPTSGVRPPSDEPLSRRESAKTEKLHQDASADPGLHPSLDSDHGLVTLAFPSTTWSSCPSPQMTTPRSGSGPKLTPPASVTLLESHRWPVLPPISPVRGRCGTAASRFSELSCSQSRVFDELEAIAPRSTSCSSLDQPSDSSGCCSPDTELSPGLAALTVGCDSGNLGSLSRVQLLLLDRPEPDTPLSPFGQEEELSPGHWADLRMQVRAGIDFRRCSEAPHSWQHL
ncbi:protein transport protein SEC31-like [Cottoperca gobio]|uniref:Protein transport protein SEC31-like n=1 Tax=Cottoperca gobio TaxID=56716 RepID=A0A6J2S8U9_COTGO|nr:protein transport protein SEC31-like [Cottoperca gobio]